nr:NUT family member 2G-like [Dasypus novemcinctus]
MGNFCPVLRSLAHQKPTMSLDEGLQRAVQDWRHTSNFDRMIYYEMAAKFKEFEIEEERQIQMLEERKGFQCPPQPVPPNLHPQVSPGTMEGQKPVRAQGQGFQPEATQTAAGSEDKGPQGDPT